MVTIKTFTDKEDPPSEEVVHMTVCTSDADCLIIAQMPRNLE